MDKQELLARTKSFALRSLKLVDHLPRTPSGRAVVAEEADECVYWLELLRDSDLMADSKIGPLLKEANELTAIFTSARRTSTQNQTSKIKPQT